MGFTVKDKLLSLIFPSICVVYGVIELLSGIEPIHKAAAPIAIAAGVIVGALILIFKINIVGYLKVLTVSTVISYLMWVFVGGRIDSFAVTGGLFNIDLHLQELISNIYNICVLLGAVIISALKMPEGTSVRDRLIVFFANPVFYSLLKWLWMVISDFLVDSGALVL